MFTIESVHCDQLHFEKAPGFVDIIKYMTLNGLLKLTIPSYRCKFCLWLLLRSVYYCNEIMKLT